MLKVVGPSCVALTIATTVFAAASHAQIAAGAGLSGAHVGGAQVGAGMGGGRAIIGGARAGSSQPAANTGGHPGVGSAASRGSYGHDGQRYRIEGPSWRWGLAAGASAGSRPVHGDNRKSVGASCMQRFRSYDPGSGTYLGYDGRRRACR
jgi:hypothetical protein